MIVEVNEKSNAYKTLFVQDQVISIDDKKFNSQPEIIEYLDKRTPGDFININVLRSGDEVVSKQIKLSARDDGSAFIGINIEQKFVFPIDVTDNFPVVG